MLRRDVSLRCRPSGDLHHAAVGEISAVCTRAGVLRVNRRSWRIECCATDDCTDACYA
jgi:hypothetical protein